MHNLGDCVAFTDAEGTVTHWNDAMQQLTGIAADAIVGKTWNSAALRLREPMSRPEDVLCPVTQCLGNGVSIARPMLIEQPGSEATRVQVNVSPVVGEMPGTYGAVVIVRDVSDHADLQARVESLREKTTIDPLTGVANRSCFDETLRDLTESAADGDANFSLVICDIDYFKQVNDVHGHPAGDEALISFAAVLTAHSRDGDLVARYGGEEFLLLAINCDNATATSRAEAIRLAIQRTSLPSLGGDSVTASFGVTEYQAGDTPESLVARADRALLKAKDNGRNRVVQLGSGTQQQGDHADANRRRGLLGWFGSSTARASSEIQILTPVPADLAIEKLRGFIADHQAEVINVSENQVSLKAVARCTVGGRRRIDHQIGLHLQLTLHEHVVDRDEADTRPNISKTKVDIHIRPIRNRDRRRRELKACVDQMITSLRSYLMGEVVRVRHGE
jgi:diguanylate cyclase (GGDEF)-like protein/PAS domain S-box-containing protein